MNDGNLIPNSERSRANYGKWEERAVLHRGKSGEGIRNFG